MIKIPRIHLILILIIIVWIILLRLPSLIEPFDNDSGANAYHARLITRGEPLYSSHHSLHHFPAVYYTYAFAFVLLGDSAWSVKVMLIPWTITTAIIIYIIGIRLADKRTGFWAAIFYGLLTSHMLLKGTSAENEIFANLPIALAILLGLEFTFRQLKSWIFVLPGIIAAMAFLYKPVFISPILTITLIIFTYTLYKGKSPATKKYTARCILFLWIGFIALVFVIVGIYAASGLLSRFLLVFELGNIYRNELPRQWGALSIVVLPLTVLGINNIVLLILGLVGFYRLTIQIKRNQITTINTIITGLAIISWFLLSTIPYGISRVGFLHYSLIIVPPLSLIAAWEFINIYNKIRYRFAGLQTGISLIPAILILGLIFLVSGFSNFRQYHHYVLHKLGYESYHDFLRKGTLILYDEYLKVEQLTEYITTHTAPEDRIYYWSDNVQLYYLTDRRAPIDNIWPFYAEATGPYQRIFSPDTRYVIVGNSVNTARPDWLGEELFKNYLLELTIDDEEIYRRTHD